MRSLLVDTGPLYALLDPDDAHHDEAHDQLRRSYEIAPTLSVAYPTLLETYTLVIRRSGARVAQRWLRDANEGLGLINPTAQDYASAALLVQRYPDQMITLFDTTIAVISEALDLPVWTFDSDFDVMKAKVWR